MRQISWLTAFLMVGSVIQGSCEQVEASPKLSSETAVLDGASQKTAKKSPSVKPDEPLIQEVTYQSGGGKETSVSDSLRIATYNIQNLTDGEDDGYRRTTKITRTQIKNAAKIVSEMNADILTIQEIENMAVLSRLNGELSAPYAHLYISQFRSTRRDEKLNVALASRVPLLEVVELDFHSVKETPVNLSRGTLRFMVALEEDRILLGYGVHLKSNHGEHEENVQKRKISTEIIRTDADSVVAANPDQQIEVIVLGDTNVDPDLPKWADDPSLSPFDDWTDLWSGVPIGVRTTLAKRLGDPELAFDPVAFDRMIVSPALSDEPWVISQPVVKQAGVDTNNIYVSPGQNDIHVSDHFPVYADILKSGTP